MKVLFFRRELKGDGKLSPVFVRILGERIVGENEVEAVICEAKTELEAVSVTVMDYSAGAIVPEGRDWDCTEASHEVVASLMNLQSLSGDCMPRDVIERILEQAFLLGIQSVACPDVSGTRMLV